MLIRDDKSFRRIVGREAMKNNAIRAIFVRYAEASLPALDDEVDGSAGLG